MRPRCICPIDYTVRAKVDSCRALCTLGLIVGTLAACGGGSAPPQTQKPDAPSGTKAPLSPLLGPRPLALKYKTLAMPSGVDSPALVQAKNSRSSGKTFGFVIVQRDSIPPVEAWATWRAQGIEYAAYLGDRTWVLRVSLPSADVSASLQQVMSNFGAHSMTAMKSQYKASPELRQAKASARATDADRNAIVLLSFFSGTAPATMDSIAQKFHRGKSGIDKHGDLAIGLRISPSDIASILENEEVQSMEEGPFQDQPLMNVARLNTGVDAVQQIDTVPLPPTFAGWSGKGVKLSNNEGLDINHDDFWNHNGSGVRTTSRWTGCTSGNGDHGTMTAGIMLGNGWRSSANGVAKFAYRGIAPEAIYSCSGDADIQNWSFTDSNGDYSGSTAAIDTQVRTGRIRVGAVANQGITPQYGVEAGYYSVYRPSKNEIIVANFNPIDFQWNRSSIGPTWDGRIKPDLSAPGGSLISTRNITEKIQLDIDSVQVLRTGGNITWTFNDSGANWHGGWGQEPWWGIQNMDAPVPVADGANKLLRSWIRLPPYGDAWQNRPFIATSKQPDGTSALSINGTATDQVRIRYRLPSLPDWTNAAFTLQWSNAHTTYTYKATNYRVYADGLWHTATIPVGTLSDWTSLTGIDALMVKVQGAPQWRPAYGSNAYGAAGGSSASSPFVAGAVALLLDQMHTRFNVAFGDRVSKSPFWVGAPSNGQPLPSTFKAILTHTAQDLAYMPVTGEPMNPDTGAVTAYHRGPDLVSGYGMLDAQEATRLVEAHYAGTQFIVERELSTSAPQTFTINVPAGSRGPLKVTLAWDDPEASPLSSPIVPKLVNDLDLKLTAPNGSVYYPWSIDLPYVPSSSSQYPGAIEPEPITAASIHPARRDIPNTRDNLEQVMVEFPQAGAWTVTVSPTGMAAPPQKYSLILGTPPKPAPDLTGGKVVFVSTRVTPAQIYLKEVGVPGGPIKLTQDAFPVRHPAWSLNGQYIAYITSDIIVGPVSNQVSVLKVVDTAGNLKAAYHAPTVFGKSSLGYPAWSPDGKRIMVTAYDEWGVRGLSTIDFSAPYNWNTYGTTVLVPPGIAPSALDATDAVFSRDGRFVYFHAENDQFSGGLFRIPASGGTAIRLYGDAEPVRRAYQISLSDDGRRLLFNSEMWKEGAPKHIDEELMELNLMTGALTQCTSEPGNQYGSFAINARAYEYVVQSNPSPNGNIDIFLEQNGARVLLDIADPLNSFNDHAPQWWKAPLPPPPIAQEEMEKEPGPVQ